MAAVAYTRAESTTCSLNILAEFALDSAEHVHVADAPSKRKRPSRDTADTNTHVHNMSHQSMQLQGHRDEEHQTHRRVQHPGLVYDDLDPMMMASDPEAHAPMTYKQGYYEMPLHRTNPLARKACRKSRSSYESICTDPAPAPSFPEDGQTSRVPATEEPHHQAVHFPREPAARRFSHEHPRSSFAAAKESASQMFSEEQMPVHRMTQQSYSHGSDARAYSPQDSVSYYADPPARSFDHPRREHSSAAGFERSFSHPGLSRQHQYPHQMADHSEQLSSATQGYSTYSDRKPMYPDEYPLHEQSMTTRVVQHPAEMMPMSPFHRPQAHRGLDQDQSFECHYHHQEAKERMRATWTYVPDAQFHTQDEASFGGNVARFDKAPINKEIIFIQETGQKKRKRPKTKSVTPSAKPAEKSTDSCRFITV